MKTTKAIPFLQGIAVFALLVSILGGLIARTSISRSATDLATAMASLRDGLGDGYMGLVVAMVLVAPPISMLVVAFEGRHTRIRSLWIAVATAAIFVASAVVAVIAQ